MTREFVIMPEFENQWSAMGLSDKELSSLQYELTITPKIGDVIKGTGGLRKFRYAFENRGKSGSVRVCYIDFVVKERIYLITAYPKNKKENLSKEECNEIKKLVKLLEESL